MPAKLLNRETFKTECFKRDKNKCVFCNKDAVDAHHIFFHIKKIIHKLNTYSYWTL